MIDLPEFLPLKVTQSTGKAGTRDIDALDHLLVVLPPRPRAAAWRGLPNAPQLRKLLDRAVASGNSPATNRLDNRRGTAITVAVFDARDAFTTLVFARKLIAESSRAGSSKLGLIVAGLDAETTVKVQSALLRAADAAAFALASFRRDAPKPGPSLPKSLRLLALAERLPLDGLRRGNQGNNLARWLTALPPNVLTAKSYCVWAKALAKQHGLEYEFLNIGKLERLGAGAFLAVAQGNAEDDAGIIRLRYRPKGVSKPALALVGKGILFDTGGTNLKPFQGMLEMHTDMQGSAVALGTAIELALGKADFGFDVWLAVTENRLSATAYKSQDVIVAANGINIQVIHTDAEGRMVLADTLTLAAREKPALIVDYATLTGACVSALTTRYSGVFSNRAASARDLLGAGMTSGERVWPFPLDDDYDEPLKSDIADVKQCAIEGGGDHIFATRFLKRFVPDDIAWVHVDLSSGQHKGGLGAIPTDITGFGVAFTLELLRDGDPAAVAARWS